MNAFDRSDVPQSTQISTGCKNLMQWKRVFLLLLQIVC